MPFGEGMGPCLWCTSLRTFASSPNGGVSGNPQLTLGAKISVVGTQSFAPICPFFGKPIMLETSKTDEDGRAIHEECYVLKINLHKTARFFWRQPLVSNKTHA
jgi:hypothetical protein